MARFYSVFGLTVETDREIPGLVPGKAAPPADLRIATGRAGWRRSPEDAPPFFVSPYRNRAGEPVLRVWRSPGGGWYRFLYDDGAEFLIDREARRVRGRWPERLAIEDVAPYLLGPILGFALRLRGVTCLHASAVEVEGRAIALVGPAGAGKSTTAAAFARRGHGVLTDDIVALADRDGRFGVHAAYPWLRLWPPSVEALFGSREALPRIAPDDPEWDKRYLDLSVEGYDFSARPLPLAAVYILRGRRGQPEAPLVVDEPRREKLMTLVANTYVNYLLDRELRAREFELLARLVRTLPVRVVVPHSDPDRLSGLCEVILDDYAGIAAGRGDRAGPPVRSPGAGSPSAAS